jgi:type IV pilus biogenesis protein CpaD/CtpE
MNKPTPNYRPAFHPFVLALCAALLFGGCASTKNAASRDAIADLKTAHLAFIDEFTEGAGKTWDDSKLTTSTAALEKQFADAEQAKATQTDAGRKRAISNLHSQFKRDAAMLESQKAFFRTTFATDLKKKVSRNYDLALKGEDTRS